MRIFFHLDLRYYVRQEIRWSAIYTKLMPDDRESALQNIIFLVSNAVYWRPELLFNHKFSIRA